MAILIPRGKDWLERLSPAGVVLPTFGSGNGGRSDTVCFCSLVLGMGGSALSVDITDSSLSLKSVPLPVPPSDSRTGTCPARFARRVEVGDFGDFPGGAEYGAIFGGLFDL